MCKPRAGFLLLVTAVIALLWANSPWATTYEHLLHAPILALAIIDDIGAILIIAVFYSSGVAWSGLVIVGLGVLAVLVMQRVGVRNSFLYIGPGIVVWGGMLYAGTHPTIAGVILGLLTPVRSWYGHQGFVQETERVLDHLRSKAALAKDPRDLLPKLERINIAQREAIPPVTRIEAALHPWVAFGIMPLFALANAGVAFGTLGDVSSEATMGVVVAGVTGLVVGFGFLPRVRS